MAKLTLNSIGSRYGSVDALNDNFDAIEAALENTLSRDGTSPNAMEADLDMNNQDILNAKDVNTTNLYINGVQVEPSLGVTSGAVFQTYEFTATAGQTLFSVAPSVPQAASLTVSVNGLVLPPSEISVNSTNVVLPACTRGDEVLIRRYTTDITGSYVSPTSLSVQRFSGNGVATSFTLGVSVATGGASLNVYIGGIYQNRNTYTTSGNVLTFTEAPVAGTENIEVLSFDTVELGATSSDLVSYLPAGTGAVTRTTQAKLRDVVSVKDFGAVGDGIADDTVALQAARDYLVSLAVSNIALPVLIFPAGTYLYSVSPNWAIQSAVILPQGEVKLRYTGTGTAVLIDAGISGLVYNVTFGSLDNYFKIEAPSTAQNGIFCRSVHHSNVFVNVRGCGANWAAMRIEFAVCTTFGVMASANQGPWYLGAVPKRGIEATRRAVNDTCSACIFINPVIEAVSETGIWFDHAIKNLILNGTSEGNPSGWGVVCTQNSQYNNFDGIDLEVNALGGIQDGGRGNSYINVLDSDLTSITATALNTKFINGTYNTIQNAGNGTEFIGIEYGSAGGTFTDTGQFTTKRSIYFITGNRYLSDINPQSLEATISCPNNTATTVLTLPLVGNNVYQVVAWIPGTGAASVYGVYAVIYQDLNTSRIVTQNNSVIMTLTLSGQNVQITQTSGVTASVYARAVAI